MARFHLALVTVPGIGPTAASRLLEAFPDAQGAFGAATAELQRLGLSPRQADAVTRFTDFAEVDRLLARASQLGLAVIAINEPAYPASLRTIDAPPPVLFVKGQLDETIALAVTVVGTRHPTLYGETVAEHLGAALAKSGIATVSGGARGVDACAHRGALSAGGKTVAVLGTGLDIVYPAEHAGLFRQIVEAGGALVSELPPGTRPDKGTFPARNRIMVGLGRVCVVVEAGEKSGALISARNAAEQGKTVLAVPGQIDRAASRGTNRLLRDGAKPLLEIKDVVEEVLGEHLRRGRAEDEAVMSLHRRVPALPGDAGAVLNALAPEAANTDTLVKHTGLTAARVNAALLELELQGLVVRRPGNLYVAKLEV
jgi:DNA processing protein